MLATKAKLKRLVTAKILLDHAQKEFLEASADLNMISLDRDRVVMVNGAYYLVEGRDNGPPYITEIPPPVDLDNMV